MQKGLEVIPKIMQVMINNAMQDKTVAPAATVYFSSGDWIR